MKRRRNIVGSEVGHARPPVYMRRGHRSRRRSRGGAVMLLLMVVAIVVSLGVFALN